MTKIKKTIGFTIGSLNPGGAERVITCLANELVANYNVIIITLEKCDSFYELNPKIMLLNCNLIIPENQNMIGSIRNHSKTIKKISGFIKSESIDLMIGFTTSVNVLSIISAKLNNIPIIISERNNPIADPPNKFWKILRNSLYRFTDYLVVQTSSNKDFYAKIIPSKKIVIIKNPVAPTLTSKRIIREENKKNKTILTVGRLDSNKSQDLLIKAYSNISNKNDWQLQIIGDGDKMDEYKTIAKDLNIDHTVSFLGNVSNVYDYYNNASIFVFTSKSEGYPNALAEALYFGIPSISTNCPHGPSDLIDNDINGILIEVDNQKMLEHQLKRLMIDEDLRDNLSKSAIVKSHKLDISLITSSWTEYFNKLL
ncbi:glycosyltransferase [Psychroserpens jangbogonensis]|uniref:glycosyltransferase n=1 Tax=Psychroserpens jangbogonensis TaxID=1484460 RepID=UPI00053DD043|nr:glycosyltransferase [Psychroserpens jangbogonensis]